MIALAVQHATRLQEANSMPHWAAEERERARLLTVKQHQARQGHHEHKACRRQNPGGVARIGGRAGQR